MFETIECAKKLDVLASYFIFEAIRDFHEDFFDEFAVEEGSNHVNLMLVKLVKSH